MAFHGGISWLPAGFLGVDTFFVLSGFLITSLLISEWQHRHTIALGQFWARRARRLLPALLLLLVFVVLYAAFVAPAGTYPGLRLDSLSTLFYVANWHFILTGSNYFDQTSLPSLLTHTWSLAVEEQFYLVWPLVVLGVLKFTGRLWALLTLSAMGAVASAVEMTLLFRHGAGLTRLYYGTDTHGQCMLVGAALASGLAIFARRRHAPRGPERGEASARGGPGVGGVERLGPYPAVDSRCGGGGGRRSPLVAGLLQRLVPLARRVLGGRAGHGGRPALCGLRPAVMAGQSPFRQPPALLGPHFLWPLPLALSALPVDRRAADRAERVRPLRRALRVTVAVATVSFYLVERPIRQGTFFRQWRGWVGAPVAVAAVSITVVLATGSGTRGCRVCSARRGGGTGELGHHRAGVGGQYGAHPLCRSLL